MINSQVDIPISYMRKMGRHVGRNAATIDVSRVSQESANAYESKYKSGPGRNPSSMSRSPMDYMSPPRTIEHSSRHVSKTGISKNGSTMVTGKHSLNMNSRVQSGRKQSPLPS